MDCGDLQGPRDVFDRLALAEDLLALRQQPDDLFGGVTPSLHCAVLHPTIVGSGLHSGRISSSGFGHLAEKTCAGSELPGCPYGRCSGDGVVAARGTIVHDMPSQRASKEVGRRGNNTGLTIQSVERAAELLSFFTVGRPRLNLTEITNRLGVSKATAHRYVMALRRVNLLRYDRNSSEYTLGPQVLTLAAVARAGLPIIALAGPLMQQLVREVNETVVLSVWDGEAPVVVQLDDRTDRMVRVSVRVGSRLSVRDSAQGRMFAAFLDVSEVSDLEDELGRSSQLRKELAGIRETGIAINTPQIHGVRTVAAPVFGDGKIVAVMAVLGTTATMSDDISSSVAKALKRTASKLTELFGAHDVDGEGPTNGEN